MISAIPAAAIAANQRTMTGPKSRPIAAVPRRWIANSRARTPIVHGRMIEERLGAATSTPSTAERTEIAGVIIASAKKSATPITPAVSRAVLTAGRSSVASRTRAYRAITPPSPSLSARMTKTTNLIETINVSDQATSEMTP